MKDLNETKKPSFLSDYLDNKIKVLGNLNMEFITQKFGEFAFIKDGLDFF